MNVLQALESDQYANYYVIGPVVIGHTHPGILTLEGMQAINETVIRLHKDDGKTKFLLADLRGVTRFPNGLREQLKGAGMIVSNFEKSILLTNNIGLELFGTTINRLLRIGGFAIVGSVEQAAKEFGVPLVGYA